MTAVMTPEQEAEANSWMAVCAPEVRDAGAIVASIGVRDAALASLVAAIYNDDLYRSDIKLLAHAIRLLDSESGVAVLDRKALALSMGVEAKSLRNGLSRLREASMLIGDRTHVTLGLSVDQISMEISSIPANSKASVAGASIESVTARWDVSTEYADANVPTGRDVRADLPITTVPAGWDGCMGRPSRLGRSYMQTSQPAVIVPVGGDENAILAIPMEEEEDVVVGVERARNGVAKATNSSIEFDPSTTTITLRHFSGNDLVIRAEHIDAIAAALPDLDRTRVVTIARSIVADFANKDWKHIPNARMTQQLTKAVRKAADDGIKPAKPAAPAPTPLFDVVATQRPVEAIRAAEATVVTPRAPEPASALNAGQQTASKISPAWSLDEIWKALDDATSAIPGFDASKNPNLISLAVVQAWIAGGAHLHDDVVPTLRQVSAQIAKSGRAAPKSWGYFTPAVNRTVAERRATEQSIATAIGTPTAPSTKRGGVIDIGHDFELRDNRLVAINGFKQQLEREFPGGDAQGACTVAYGDIIRFNKSITEADLKPIILGEMQKRQPFVKGGALPQTEKERRAKQDREMLDALEAARKSDAEAGFLYEMMGSHD